MVTQKQKRAALGYPKNALGRTLGPEDFDSDYIASSEQVRRSHSPGWYENRLAKARKSRLAREARMALLAGLRLSPDTTMH